MKIVISIVVIFMSLIGACCRQERINDTIFKEQMSRGDATPTLYKTYEGIGTLKNIKYTKGGYINAQGSSDGLFNSSNINVTGQELGSALGYCELTYEVEYNGGKIVKTTLQISGEERKNHSSSVKKRFEVKTEEDKYRVVARFDRIKSVTENYEKILEVNYLEW